MKILVVSSTLDLKFKLGCTPSWFQLFKALHEIGNEVIVVPYLGDPVESLWWRTYPNPCASESKCYNYLLECKKRFGNLTPKNEKESSFINNIIDRYAGKKWTSHILSILEKEKDIDAVFFIVIPITHISGIAEKIHQRFNIPVMYIEGDMPIGLPQYVKESGYKFSYYNGSDLSEFDAFFTNSKGVIPELKIMGARNIHTLYYAVDPELFKPVSLPKNIDISFFGYGTGLREKWMTAMITEPSKKMITNKFVIGGKDLRIDLGNADFIGDLSFSAFRNFCCRSKICLNITRLSHTSVYASSSARPFELAAFGACIVSNLYLGIEEWFEPGKELVIVKDEAEIEPIYQQLLDSDSEREKLGECARTRILKDHTYKKRAEDLIAIIKSCKQ
jgi:glycosyltransferase involved in cell wall biosynthesis